MRKPAKTGFTLTEVLVASALLVAAIVPILKAMTSMHFNTAVTERRICALNIAQSKLEEIRARSIYNYAASFAENNSSPAAGYLINVADSAISSDLRKITVTAGFDSDSNNNLSSDEQLVNLSTCFARRW